MVNVIIVDDEVRVSNYLTTLLIKDVKEIKQIFQATNGEEALALLKEERIDIVIADIVMPVMDGITMCKKIREFNQSVKIILISAFAEFEYAKEALRYAVSDYIVKPIDREEYNKLKKMIQDHVKNKEKKLGFYLSLHDEDLHKKVRKALKMDNASYLFDIIEKLSIKSHGDVLLTRECSILIVTAIFDYIDEMGFSHTQQSKRDAIADLMSCDTADACISCVEELAISITQFAPKSMSLEKIVKQIKHNIDKNSDDEERFRNLCVNQLSQQYNVSRTPLGAAFKKEYGVSLNNYIVETKMRYAEHLLLSTDYSIAKISEILGYSNFVGFKKMFRKHSSKLPTEYRHDERKDELLC